MFSTWDDEIKAYNILYSDGRVASYTTQQLYEYFIFNDLGIGNDFSDLKGRLDRGESVSGDDCQWDWNTQCNVYKGRIVITKITGAKGKVHHKETNGCKHENKYINEAGGIKFYVCPKCKADLGDA